MGCGVGGAGCGSSFGGALGCSFTIAFRLVFSPMVTRSTGTTGESWMLRSSLCAKVNSVAPMTRTCRTVAVMMPSGDVFSPAPEASEILFPIARLCDIRDKSDMREPRGADLGHHLHHPAIVHRLVAAHEDALVVAVGGNGTKLGDELIFGNRRVLKIDLSIAAHGDGERLAIL